MNSLLASIAVLALTASFVHASVNPTTFPFQQCVQVPSENRWSVKWHNYTEDAQNGSRMCFDLVEASNATCYSNKRCCATGVNKFKWYPAANCQRQVEAVTWKGVSTGAVFYEEIGTPQFIGKVVNLNIVDLGPAGGTASTLCLSLKGLKNGGTCPIFSDWMNPLFAMKDIMPVALYDHKANNYECCPITQVLDPLADLHHVKPPTSTTPLPFAPSMPPAYPPPAGNKASAPPKRTPPPAKAPPPMKVGKL